MVEKNIVLVNTFETFQKHFLFLISEKNVYQAHVCVMAKPTKIMLDRKSLKCLPNNACSFGRGFTDLSTKNRFALFPLGIGGFKIASNILF